MAPFLRIMENLLIRSLTKISRGVIKSVSTTYFIIGNIKVRVSDHMSENTDADLAIIKTQKEYVVFPLKVAANKKIMIFSNISRTIRFIQEYAYFYDIFIMHANQKRRLFK